MLCDPSECRGPSRIAPTLPSTLTTHVDASKQDCDEVAGAAGAIFNSIELMLDELPEVGDVKIHTRKYSRVCRGTLDVRAGYGLKLN